MESAQMKIVAQAYGVDAYGECVFSDDKTCSDQVTQMTQTTPSAPNTGFLRQQPVLSVGILMIVAVVLYIATVVLLKKLRTHRK